MIKLDELTQKQIGPVGFEFLPSGHLKLKTKTFPWSIVQKEFDYLYNLIVNNNLTKGYEACTGVGISALAAGLAMKQTGGKIVTLDAYIEEHLDTSNYHNHDKLINQEALAYQTVHSLIEKYDLKNVLFPIIGWTPDDVPFAIESNFNEPLDYVFIDGGHFPHQVIADITAVLPYTNESTHWLFHDANVHCFNQNVHDFIKEKFNKSIQIVCPESEGCNDLAILI
jgi:hypothetical protein